MKPRIFQIIIFQFLFFVHIQAQNRYDKNWVLGLEGTNGVILNMEEPLPGIENVNIPIDMTRANTTINDSIGNLLFYTNACTLANKFHKIPPGGDNFCPGLKVNNIGNGVLALPIKSESGPIYYVFANNGIIFYKTKDEIYGGSDKIITHKIIPSSIKDSFVIVEYKFPSKDTFSLGYLTACQHANGNDWWIINHKSYSNEFMSYLVKADTILAPVSSTVGKNIDNDDNLGQAVFTPNGEHYIFQNFLYGVQIFDFDRCTGKLSNPISFGIPISDTLVYFTGAAVSPNSRYLYLTTAYRLYQYDLWANDIESSAKLIAYWGGGGNFLLYMQLAANGKIYITPDQAKSYGVIEYPDSMGQACGFISEIFLNPSCQSLGLPNLPHFRLGALDIDCDTLTSAISRDKQKSRLKIYPNPVTSYFIVESIDEYGFGKGLNFELTDLNGQVIKREPLALQTLYRDIKVDDLPNGLYIWHIKKKGQIEQSGKVVIHRNY